MRDWALGPKTGLFPGYICPRASAQSSGIDSSFLLGH
jgi:hypothetical protein